jgi:hypothetical protein
MGEGEKSGRAEIKGASKFLSLDQGGVVSVKSATGNGLLLPTAPLPSNLPQRGAEL